MGMVGRDFHFAGVFVEEGVWEGGVENAVR